MTQLVVIHQIFIAQRQREDPLPDQPHHFVLDQLRRAAVRKTAGKPLDQPDRPIRRPQQQGTRIRGDLAAVKPGHHRTPLNACKTEQIRATLCMHRVSPLALRQTVGPTRFSQIPEPDAPTLCEKCGLGPETMNTGRRLGFAGLIGGLVFLGASQVRAADPEIDRLLQSPVAKDWVSNGGNMTNQRYSYGQVVVE